MKILLQFVPSNYKMWHSLAKRLKELYPESRFAGMVGPQSYMRHFLEDQQDVKYHFFKFDNDYPRKAFESKIDFDSLREFEEYIPHKSLWRLVASDGKLGSRFVHGAVIRKSYVNQNATYENILRYFTKALNDTTRIFDEFKPDLFLPPIVMSGITTFIYEHLSKKYNILHVVPANVRVKNLFAFSDDTQLRFPQINATYKKLLSSNKTGNLADAEDLYNDLMSELKNPKYFDRLNSRFNIIRFDSLLGKAKWLGLTIKGVLREMVRWQKENRLKRSTDISKRPEDPIALLSGISYNIQFMYQKLRLTNPKFWDEFNPREKYLYYPLHINPEYSTQVQGNVWLDQVYLIGLLAESIPFDWKIYVKEHPGTLVARTRPLPFYNEIRKFPNVRLIPIDTDMHTLISNAQMVAVITGTSGWEAILRGRPVLTFADNAWDVLELSRKCGNVEALSGDIYNEVRRLRTISPGERRKRIIYFLAAVLEHSFNITYPNQFSYIEPGTDEEYETVGRETADGLKRYLDYLNIIG